LSTVVNKAAVGAVLSADFACQELPFVNWRRKV
jgi:hypothetical protein